MKKILITGANSYIGTSFEKYIKENYPDDYIVDTVDMIDGTWRDKDFSGYDTVFHVAGIAHQKETSDNVHLYYKVNRDLAIETAKKAKIDGVNQFVFLSSMSVYGKDVGIVTKETLPHPKSNYGKSKLQAEEEINKLADDVFKVCIIRPPMVYGKNCKGNFQSIVRLVKTFSIFPKIKNERSMIYIDNLSCFIKLCIDRHVQGICFPQNKEYVETVCIAKHIANKLDKKMYFSFVLGVCVSVLRCFFPLAKKAFGTLVYSGLEEFDYCYCIVLKEDSIERSV